MAAAGGYDDGRERRHVQTIFPLRFHAVGPALDALRGLFLCFRTSLLWYQTTFLNILNVTVLLYVNSQLYPPISFFYLHNILFLFPSTSKTTHQQIYFLYYFKKLNYNASPNKVYIVIYYILTCMARYFLFHFKSYIF